MIIDILLGLIFIVACAVFLLLIVLSILWAYTFYADKKAAELYDQYVGRK